MNEKTGHMMQREYIHYCYNNAALYGSWSERVLLSEGYLIIVYVWVRVCFSLFRYLISL